MKSKLFLAIGLILVLFVITGCASTSSGSATFTQSDFYGTWYSPRNVPEGMHTDFDITVTISANEIILIDTDGDGFTIRNLTWERVRNPVREYQDEFPAGYRITGTYAGGAVYYTSNVGSTIWAQFFISTDGKSIARHWPSREVIHSIYTRE
jgi:hypothetical protein